RLEDGERLADLHRPTLERAEHFEELLGGLPLDVGVHRLGGRAAEPPPEPAGAAPGVPERERGEPGGTPGRASGDLCHTAIVSPEPESAVDPGWPRCRGLRAGPTGAAAAGAAGPHTGQRGC